MSIIINMKKASPIAEEIAAQKKELRAIEISYGVNTTAIANRANLAPSTINRFVNALEPANALSAVTMRKIRESWPINDTSNERENGLLSLLSISFALLEWRNIVKLEDLKNLLSEESKNFRMKNQPGAVEVVEKLMGSLGLIPQQSKIQAIHKLLQRPQAE